MFDFLEPLGLKNLANKKEEMKKLVKHASLNPDLKKSLSQESGAKILTESYMEFGDGFGIAIYDSVSAKGKKAQKWHGYAKSSESMDIVDVFIEDGLTGRKYVLCEEKQTGTQFEFELNNMIDYELHIGKSKGDGLYFEEAEVNVAILACYGNVLLPIYKPDDYDAVKDEEEKATQDLIEKARAGDRRAKQKLSKQEAEDDKAVFARLKKEDLYSVFEGYLLNLAPFEGHFSILAEIISADYLKNKWTDETVIKLGLDNMGVNMDLFINELDLQGMPAVGMRFAGLGYIQGVVDFKTAK